MDAEFRVSLMGLRERHPGGGGMKHILSMMNIIGMCGCLLGLLIPDVSARMPVFKVWPLSGSAPLEVKFSHCEDLVSGNYWVNFGDGESTSNIVISPWVGGVSGLAGKNGDYSIVYI